MSNTAQRRSFLIRIAFEGRQALILEFHRDPPPENAPASIARNDNGDVVADLFEFRRSTLLRFADWIEEFSGFIGPADASTLDIEVPTFTRFRAEALEALRSLGS